MILIQLNLPPHLSQAPLPQAEQETLCTEPNPAALMPPPVLRTACQIQGHAGDVQCAECWARSLDSAAWRCRERQLLHLFPLWEAQFVSTLEKGINHGPTGYKNKAEPVPAWAE